MQRQPDGARLLEQRDVEPLLLAGRDVVPALRRRHLRTVRQALRVEHAERPLSAALPLADTFARIVDVAVDMTAGELDRGLRAALEGDVDELDVGGLADQARQGLVGVLRLRTAHLCGAVLGLHRLEVILHVLVGRILLHPQQELVLHHGRDRREIGVVERDLRDHGLRPGVRGAEHEVVRIARQRLGVGVALCAAAARLVDHHDRLVEQLVLHDRSLHGAREVVGAAAGAGRGDELDLLGRRPGRRGRDEQDGRDASDQGRRTFCDERHSFLRMDFLFLCGGSVHWPPDFI